MASNLSNNISAELSENSTIAAIATASGIGGIAVIRISGTNAYEIASRVFTPLDKNKNLLNAKGYTAMFGHFISAGKKLDEIIALCFRAPHSYTGEDVIELSCHGGAAVSELLLRACFDNGARPAQGGEFTKRAVLNGRISLTQAEAVMEIINASSKQSAAAAANLMQGALYKKIDSVRQSLITLAGHIAAFTDYPEEDVPELEMQTLAFSVKENIEILNALIDGYDKGKILRRGIQTAIVGSPNVGKSTIMNLLSGFERAIVTPIAGTTRDIIEQEISIGDVRLILSDTAGMRETQDIVESEGIKRAQTALENSELVICVFDASAIISEQDIKIAQSCNGKVALAVLNKNDLDIKFNLNDIKPFFSKVISISANNSNYLNEIINALYEILGVSNLSEDALLMCNERQLLCAKAAKNALDETLHIVEIGLTLDAAGVCIDEALNALYELTGENASEDIINEVFSKFCVGK